MKGLRLSLVALAVSLLACRAATVPVGRTAPPAVRAPAFAPTPLLWEVRGPDGQGRAWIYGTLHTGGATFVPQAAWDALAASKTFVMEADIEHINQRDVIARATLPESQSLEALMSPEGWKRLVAAFAGKIPEPQLRRFKPWFVSVVLAQSFLPGGEATDQALKARAAEQGATVAYLESWQEQLDALEAGTDVASLELMLSDLARARREMDALVDAYRAGDVDAIVRITHDPASGMSPAALDRLLYARNRAWLPKIEALVAEGGAFVAVGAGHIPGPGGLLELLGARGYSVTRAPGPRPTPTP